MIGDQHGMWGDSQGCSPDHGVLAHDDAVPDPNYGSLGIQGGAIHDPRPRANLHIAYENGGRGNTG
jgi:hypothetical protein